VKEICSLMEISTKKVRKSVIAVEASTINVSFSSTSSVQITVSDLNSDTISPPAEIGLEDPIESNFGGGFAEDFGGGFDEDFGDHSEYSFTYNSGDDMSDNFGSGTQGFESEENAGMTKSLQRVTTRSLYYT
jgi:hypothetical protein